MHHRLLIACLVIAKIGHLLQGLTNACHIAMTKYPKTAREKSQFKAIALHILMLQKSNDRLGHRHLYMRRIVHSSPLCSISVLLKTTMFLNKAHYFSVGWHKISTAMLRH